MPHPDGEALLPPLSQQAAGTPGSVVSANDYLHELGDAVNLLLEKLENEKSQKTEIKND